MRLGPVNESTLDPANQNQMSGAAQAAYQGAVNGYAAVTTLIDGTTLAMCIFSASYLAWFVIGGTPPIQGTTQIQSLPVNKYIRTQLTRKAPHVP